MNDSLRARPSAGSWLVRLAALWILSGALFKLLAGSPNDLPPLVRAFFLGPVLTFKLAIAVELSIAVPALLRPRWLWPFVAALLAVFCGVLVPLALAGEKSCGCFGSKVTIPPAVMLAIDGTLLLALLATRPWRAPRSRTPLLWILSAAAVLAAWVLPFSILPSGAAPAPIPGGAQAPGGAAELPRYITFEPESWIGKPIRESALAALADVEAYPQDATWVLYSVTCDHCAAYLRKLAGEFDRDPRPYVFVRLSVADEEKSRQVDLMPPGVELVLPSQVNYVLEPPPPWSLVLEGGVVKSAEAAKVE